MLKALNDDINVDDCDVFKQELLQQEPETEGADEPEVHPFPESGPESIRSRCYKTSYGRKLRIFVIS